MVQTYYGYMRLTFLTIQRNNTLNINNTFTIILENEIVKLFIQYIKTLTPYDHPEYQLKTYFVFIRRL